MDDLAVQVAHQPVDDAVVRIDVDRVIDGVSHPREVFIARHDIQVRVRRGKVREQVTSARPHRRREQAVRGDPGVAGDGFDNCRANDVRGKHPSRFFEAFASQRVTRVQDEHPEEQNHTGRHGHEGPRLKAQPQLTESPRAIFFNRGVEERHRGCGVEIHVVPHLLGRRVMLVVHVVPHVATRRQAEPRGEGLDSLVPPNVSSQRIVPTLVLHPTASRAEETRVHDHGSDVPTRVHQRRAEREHRRELGESIRHVRRRGLKKSLTLQFLAPPREILQHRLILDRFPRRRVHWLMRQRRQRLARLFRPIMKLFKSLRRVRSRVRQHVINHRSSGVLKIRHIVFHALDRHVPPFERLRDRVRLQLLRPRRGARVSSLLPRVFVSHPHRHRRRPALAQRRRRARSIVRHRSRAFGRLDAHLSRFFIRI